MLLGERSASILSRTVYFFGGDGRVRRRLRGRVTVPGQHFSTTRASEVAITVFRARAASGRCFAALVGRRSVNVTPIRLTTPSGQTTRANYYAV